MKLVDGSLKRLRTDYVDILYIHVLEDAATTSDPVIMEGMAHVKESGKARAVGVSTHTNMATVLNQAAEDGFWDIALTSVNFTMADDSELMAAIDKAAKAGIGIVGMKVTAGGSGWPNPDSRSNYDQNTIVGAAMKWVLQNENIATIIPGFSNNDMLQQDMAIGGNLDLTDQERAFLGDNSIKLGMEFCRQCGSCLAACPHGAKVPTLMRLHMYLAQYGSLPMARAALDEIPKGRGIDACTSCDHCSIECAHSVNIERRIGELKMIYA